MPKESNIIIRYLRILDGKSAGATHSDISEFVYEPEDYVETEDALKERLKGRLKKICRLPFSLPSLQGI